MGQQRRYPRPPKPSPTLRELRAGNVPVSVLCPICHRMDDLDPHTLPVPDDLTLELLQRRLRCTGCNRKGGIGASPLPEPWVRYLRATGQRDRLPWYSAMMPEEPP